MPPILRRLVACRLALASCVVALWLTASWCVGPLEAQDQAQDQTQALTTGDAVAESEEAEIDPTPRVRVELSPDAADSEIGAETEADLWLEVLPVGGTTRLLPLTATEDGAWTASLPEGSPVTRGPVRLCGAAPGLAVTCQLLASLPTGDDAAPFLVLEGAPIVGRYLLGGWPIAGADVSIALQAATGASEGAVTEALAPLGVLPLALEERTSEEPAPESTGDGIARDESAPRLVRSVATDAEGFFRLPPLAPGSYRLETVLPTGRLHRSEPFELPPPSALDAGEGAGGAGTPFDLGAIDVAEGLSVEVEAVDLEGRALAGVEVTARQGDDAATLASWWSPTDAAGRVVLSGFVAELPALVSCRADGYAPWRRQFELVPTDVDCVLEPLATVVGLVDTVEGAVPEGVRLTLDPLVDASAVGDDGAIDDVVEDGVVEDREIDDADEEAPVRLGAEAATDGSFRVDGVRAGRWRLTAAVPGFAAEILELEVEPGERLDVGTLSLLAARRVTLEIVDAADSERIAGAVVEAREPPGAASGVSDADGLVDLALGADPAMLEVRADGYAVTTLELSPRADEDGPVRVALEAGGWIRVVVHADGGAVSDGEVPCVGCVVRIPAGRGQLESTTLRTDADGEALSEALRPGIYRVVRPAVTQLGSTAIEHPEAESRRVRVRAGEMATVRFGAREETLRLLLEPAPAGRWAVTARTSTSRQRAAPDADGVVTLRRTSGESLHLYLHLWDAAAGVETEVRQGPLAPPTGDVAGAPLGALEPAPRGELGGGADRGAVDAPPTLAAGALLRMAPGDARVHGRTVRGAASGAEPVAGVPVVLRAVGEGWLAASTRSRPDGRFEIPYLPPGVYQLWLGSHAVQALSVRAGESLDVGPVQPVN
ncbi:MAG: hypothetical protein AAGC60_19355 [Acidobacteriota bacterium]